MTGGAIDFQGEAGEGMGEPREAVGAPPLLPVGNLNSSHTLFPNNSSVLQIGTISENDDWPRRQKEMPTDALSAVGENGANAKENGRDDINQPDHKRDS